MTKSSVFISLLVMGIFSSCETAPALQKERSPKEKLASVDGLLQEMAGAPQRFSIASDSAAVVTGKEGTQIFIDPDQLVTSDQSPLGKTIEVELIELTKTIDLITYNTQTVSFGKPLMNGGVYYLNMTSDGKPLQLVPGRGMDAEFPELTQHKMRIFRGKSDSLNQMNWLATRDTLAPRILPASTAEKDTIVNYEKVELMGLGWSSIDWFWRDKAPRTNVHLVVENEAIESARLFGIFQDSASVVTAPYWKGQSDTTSFVQLPSGRTLQVIGLALQDEIPHWFEQTINTETDTLISVEFTPISREKLIKRLHEIGDQQIQ